ncbi:hypothetical protein CEXT_785941 [Caerostris extrusa]|uniref:Protein kinase domain-containing protein n=1 Tax=Caerostris extrusa TaxID=172846 RepID=A0AAV4UBC9_CAEEX|nr:hypothetical protein CEXT_785941 [Caerostris extrusa]
MAEIRKTNDVMLSIVTNIVCFHERRKLVHTDIHKLHSCHSLDIMDPNLPQPNITPTIILPSNLVSVQLCNRINIAIIGIRHIHTRQSIRFLRKLDLPIQAAYFQSSTANC